MTFRNPEAFFLLIPILLTLVHYLFSQKKKIASLQYSNISQFKNISSSWRIQFRHLPIFLKIIALIFIVAALARPQTADTKVKKNVEGVDIMIVLDISDSMLIEDMKPLNRLEAAKDTIQRFVKNRVSDRIGLVVFAGEAFTMVPPTLDYELLLKRVDTIETAQAARIKDGTAIGVALANGANRLKDSAAKSKVMIFATDGENNSGTIDPETGLEIAKGYGIKIYSIGIGKDGPTKIPIYQKDVFGQTRKVYLPFESTVNEDLLSRMANETGGKYYRASREDSLQTIFADIDKLEKTKVDINKYVRYSEEFRKFVIYALISYLLSVLFTNTLLRRAP